MKILYNAYPNSLNEPVHISELFPVQQNGASSDDNCLPTIFSTE